jgi:pimeloyl-ACP methyl ester carboxylesterase
VADLGAAPGTHINVGDFKMHMQIQGTGTPTVVFEAALSGSSLDWHYVNQAVSSKTRTVAYDRAGHGWSTRSRNRREPEQIVEELKDGLTTAGIEPPYILVGHSLGAMHTRLYARKYPDDVIGMVLLDPAHIEMFARLPEPIGQMHVMNRRVMRLYALMARFGAGGVLRGMTPKAISTLPAKVGQQIREMNGSADYWATVAQENRRSKKYTRRPSLIEDTIGDLPLTVLTAGASFDPGGLPPEFPIEEVNTTWRELQAEIAAISTDSEHEIIEGASHLTLLYEPHFAMQVANYVVEMVEGLRVRHTL